MLKLFIFFFILKTPLHAAVKPAQEYFNLDTLKPFYPGINFLESDLSKYNGRLIKTQNQTKMYRLDMKHANYAFPIFLQVQQDRVVDLYVTLPTYFLHDVFHQSLINRYGKQDRYQLLNGTAYYVWEKNPQQTIHYSATCTITCFPIFFTIFNSSVLTSPEKPLIKELNGM